MLVGHFLVLETRDLFNHSRQCGVSIKSRIETMSYRNTILPQNSDTENRRLTTAIL